MSESRCMCSFCAPSLEWRRAAQLCLQRAWCLLDAGHAGPCEEIPRYSYAAPDYGPSRKGTR